MLCNKNDQFELNRIFEEEGFIHNIMVYFKLGDTVQRTGNEIMIKIDGIDSSVYVEETNLSDFYIKIGSLNVSIDTYFVELLDLININNISNITYKDDKFENFYFEHSDFIKLENEINQILDLLPTFLKKDDIIYDMVSYLRLTISFQETTYKLITKIIKIKGKLKLTNDDGNTHYTEKEKKDFKSFSHRIVLLNDNIRNYYRQLFNLIKQNKY